MNFRRCTYLAAIAVLLSGGIILCWIMVDFVRDKRTVDHPHSYGLPRSYEPAAERPRLPIDGFGEPIVGDAFDDYYSYAIPSNVKELRMVGKTDDGKYPALGADAKAILADPRVKRIIRIFVRAKRREFATKGVPRYEGIEFFGRARLVFVSAVDDFHEGRDRDGVDKVLTLFRLPHDMLGRSSSAEATLAVTIGNHGLRLLSQFQPRFSPELNALLARALDVLEHDRLAPHQIAPTLLFADAHWFAGPASTFNYNRVVHRVVDELTELSDLLQEHRVPPAFVRVACLPYVRGFHNCEFFGSATEQFADHDRKVREFATQLR